MKQLSKRGTSAMSMDVFFGKVPPQARDCEQAVLGAIMLERTAIDTAIQVLQPKCFYVESHQRIFQSMINLLQKSQPIDSLTVTEQLRSEELLEVVGGPYYVTSLTNFVTSSAHLLAHCRIVYERFMQREVIRLGGIFLDWGYQEGVDVFHMIDEAEKSIYELTASVKKKGYTNIDSLLVSAFQEINVLRQSEQKLSGITSGFKAIDKITHGWQKTDLIILAARPGVGKTAFALNLARNADCPVAFFSLEMSSGQLIRRIMAAESGITLDKISRGKMEDGDMQDLFERALKPLANKKLYIDDTPAVNIFYLRSEARRLVSKENVGLIIIDYLQLMSGVNESGRQNREQEISQISRELKKLAKELDVPIIALSQLSRETERRTNKEPQLSDLRESGAIEQDADAVLFIYRPEYYGIHRDATGESNPGETHVKFAKYRNGALGTAKIRAKLWCQKFEDLEEIQVQKKDKDSNGITTTWKKVESQIDFKDETFK